MEWIKCEIANGSYAEAKRKLYRIIEIMFSIDITEEGCPEHLDVIEKGIHNY